MIPWQRRALTGRRVLLPTARKCDIRAAVTLSQPAPEREIQPGRLGDYRSFMYEQSKCLVFMVDALSL